MRKAITLALFGALVAGPALARGMSDQQSSSQDSWQQQRSESQDLGSQSSMDQGSQSQQQASAPEDVRNIQQRLSQMGYNVTVDGQMGPQTQQAIRDFQRDNGLQPSGRLTQETVAALESSGSQQNQQAQTPGQRRGGSMDQDLQRSQQQGQDSGEYRSNQGGSSQGSMGSQGGSYGGSSGGSQ